MRWLAVAPYPVNVARSRGERLIRRRRVARPFLCDLGLAAVDAHHGFAGTPAHGLGMVGSWLGDGSGCMIT
jgi:hypothetical protein